VELDHALLANGILPPRRLGGAMVALSTWRIRIVGGGPGCLVGFAHNDVKAHAESAAPCPGGEGIADLVELLP